MSRLAVTCAHGQYALDTSDFSNRDISLLVAGAGTGGTITGISRAIRDAHANTPEAKRTTVVAVDPIGSILGGGEPGNYIVEGIGYVSWRADDSGRS